MPPTRAAGAPCGWAELLSFASGTRAAALLALLLRGQDPSAAANFSVEGRKQLLLLVRRFAWHGDEHGQQGI